MVSKKGYLTYSLPRGIAKRLGETCRCELMWQLSRVDSQEPAPVVVKDVAEEMPKCSMSKELARLSEDADLRARRGSNYRAFESAS